MTAGRIDGSGDAMKHAFLIMAHKDDVTLRTLLALLDDFRNDVFLHMDAKAVDWDGDVARYGLKRAGCYAVPRMNVAWGGVFSNSLRA